MQVKQEFEELINDGAVDRKGKAVAEADQVFKAILLAERYLHH